jgi:hypothetical protein
MHGEQQCDAGGEVGGEHECEADHAVEAGA